MEVSGSIHDPADLTSGEKASDTQSISGLVAEEAIWTCVRTKSALPPAEIEPRTFSLT